jgi:serine/threonine protein kinase
MSEESKNCPKCGESIPEKAPQGLCPKCLLVGASSQTEPGFLTSTVALLKPTAPSVEEIAPAFPELEILELIGQGGMGYVYQAKQLRLDRMVALKVLPAPLANDPAFAERFSREGRLLAHLNHPNIVTVHDYGITGTPPQTEDPAVSVNETPDADEGATDPDATVKPTSQGESSTTPGYSYLLMEFVDGVNLRQAMRAGKFTPAQALEIVPKICDALQYAHDEGVLHRDIKPENILVDSKGRVKIADFGIAKMVGEAQSEATLTGAGSTLGTPHYMAPEQIEHPSEVDHRADIYSLGVVFYELLTGELPIGRFAPPSAKTPVNDQVDAIVFRALEKERELRQQSATEIRTQIEGMDPAGNRPRSPQSGPAALKTAPCYLTTPDHLRTFTARFAHPFTDAGDLRLEAERLVFEREGNSEAIPLAAIRDLSEGDVDRWSNPDVNLSYLAITFEIDGRERTLLLRPDGQWAEPVWNSNRHVTDWEAAIRKAIAAGKHPDPVRSPAGMVSVRNAPNPLKPALIAGAILVPLFGFLGMVAMSTGEEQQTVLAWLIGMGIIAFSLLTLLAVVVGASVYFHSRRTLKTGDLNSLVRRGPGRRHGGGSANGQNLPVWSALAIGGAVLSGVALIPGALFGAMSLLILDDGSWNPAVPELMFFLFAGLGWLSCAVLGTTLGIMSLNRMQRDPDRFKGRRLAKFAAGFWPVTTGIIIVVAVLLMLFWSATPGAYLTPLTQLLNFMLPTDTVLLGGIALVFGVLVLIGILKAARGPVSPPPNYNPWPRRILLVLCLILLVPAAMFGVALLTYQSTSKGAPPPMQLAVQEITTHSNLMIVELEFQSSSRAIHLTPHLEGPPLSDQQRLNSAELSEVPTILPHPFGTIADPQLAFDYRMSHQPRSLRLAFTFPDNKTALTHASTTMATLLDYGLNPKQVRGAIVLFDTSTEGRSGYRAYLELATPRTVEFLKYIEQPGTPKQDRNKPAPNPKRIAPATNETGAAVPVKARMVPAAAEGSAQNIR